MKLGFSLVNPVALFLTATTSVGARPESEQQCVSIPDTRYIKSSAALSHCAYRCGEKPTLERFKLREKCITNCHDELRAMNEDQRTAKYHATFEEACGSTAGRCVVDFVMRAGGYETRFIN